MFGPYLANVRVVAKRAHKVRRTTTTARVEEECRGVVLRRRATRWLRNGNPRKASLALRELAAMTEAPAHYVALGHCLLGARREADGIRALRQGMWLHAQLGSRDRARSVAQIILRRAPDDRVARKYA